MFRKDFKLEMLAQDEESRNAELLEREIEAQAGQFPM